MKLKIRVLESVDIFKEIDTTGFCTYYYLN